MCEAGKTSQICNSPASQTQLEAVGRRALLACFAIWTRLQVCCCACVADNMSCQWSGVLNDVGVQCTHVLLYTRQGNTPTALCAAMIPVCKLGTEANVQMYQRSKVG